MLQVVGKAMLFHFAVYLLRFKRTSNLIRAFLRPVPPPPPTLIASGKAERCEGKRGEGSESKQSNAAAGELTTVPGRNTAIPQVNSPSGLDCSGEAVRQRGVSFRAEGAFIWPVRMGNDEWTHGRMDSRTHGLFAFATVQTNRTHNTSKKKNVDCAGFLIPVAVAVVAARVVLCV